MMSGGSPPTSCTASSTTVSMGTPDIEYVDMYNLQINFKNTEEVPAGDSLSVTFGDV
jgi:hypothetical protein